MTEQWRDVPGWEGLYRVSDLGAVRSMDRVMTLRNGQQRRYKGRSLTAWDHDGYLRVVLHKPGKNLEVAVHRLVAWAFIGPQLEGMQACHRNGVPTDNQPANLYYGTSLQNHRDALRHGTHPTQKTHCRNGHQYTETNTSYRKVHYRLADGTEVVYSSRRCIACRVASGH